MINPTKEMVKEGKDFNSALFDVSIERILGGIGGCKHFEITSYPLRWRDLLEQYVNGSNNSVELTYIAMERYRYDTTTR